MCALGLLSRKKPISVVGLLKNVLRPKTNRYRKFVTCDILT